MRITIPGSDGISFSGMLCIVFITLKLCNVIQWSWWIVLLPLYASFAIFIVICIVLLIVNVLLALCDAA